MFCMIINHGRISIRNTFDGFHVFYADCDIRKIGKIQLNVFHLVEKSEKKYPKKPDRRDGKLKNHAHNI